MLGGCTGAGAGSVSLSACASTRSAVRRRYGAACAAGDGPEWSGESGASGHPLMTADAIRQAAANFQNCLERLWPEAARRGVSRRPSMRIRAELTPDLRIMDLVDAQPEFTKAFWDYLDILVSEDRIARGREMLAQNRATFDAMETRLRRRPLCHRGDLGHRVEILHHDRRPLGGAFDRDARLYRAAAGLFPQRIPVRARNAPARRRQPGAAEGLLGRRFRPDPIHADGLQVLCRRCRWRRPSRRRRLGARPRGLDRELFQESMAGRAGRPGATRSWSRRTSISCWPTAARCMSIHEWERLGIRAPAASHSRAARIAPS